MTEKWGEIWGCLHNPKQTPEVFFPPFAESRFHFDKSNL